MQAVRIVSYPAEIRNGYLLNAGWENYTCTSHLTRKVSFKLRMTLVIYWWVKYEDSLACRHLTDWAVTSPCLECDYEIQGTYNGFVLW